MLQSNREGCHCWSMSLSPAAKCFNNPSHWHNGNSVLQTQINIYINYVSAADESEQKHDLHHWNWDCSRFFCPFLVVLKQCSSKCLSFISFMQHGVLHFFMWLQLRLNIIIPLFQVNILLRLQHWFGITQWWLDAIRKGQVTAGYGVKSFCEQAGSSNIYRSFFLVFSFSTGLRKSRLNSYAWDTLSNTVAWVLAVGRHLGIS